MGVSRSCREFVEAYKDAGINCASCRLWDYEKKECREEERVVAAHEREFDAFDRQMKSNKGVYIE